VLKLHYHPSPNPLKVALYLEEAGLPYEVIPVDTRKGEQHLPSFRAIKMDDEAKRAMFPQNARLAAG